MTTPKRGGRKAKQASKPAAARATRAKGAAQAAGAKGKRPAGVKVALRNSMILAMANRGDSWADVAAEAGITQRACQMVVKNAKNAKSLLDEQATVIVEREIRGWVESIANYKAMAHAWADSNANASLGASRAADEARKSLLTMLENVGKMPTDYERFMSEMELRAAARRMTEMLIDVREGQIELDEAINWFVSLADTGPPALPAGDGHGD